jgi:hypothetical protein
MITVRGGASASSADRYGRYLNHMKVLKVRSTIPMNAHNTLGRTISLDHCKFRME